LGNKRYRNITQIRPPEYIGEGRRYQQIRKLAAWLRAPSPIVTNRLGKNLLDNLVCVCIIYRL
jgi:hypothetical protein